VPDQVEPAVKALKAANVDPGDIWFLASRHHHLLAEPLPLQRWLDFLAAYQLATRDVVQVGAHAARRRRVQQRALRRGAEPLHRRTPGAKSTWP
jgi:hypothetical protein